MTHIAKDEALKLVLEALKVARDQIVDPEYAPIGWSVSRLDEVLANGKQALAAPVQEGRDWSLLEATQESLREHMAEIKRLKEAQPAPVQEPYCYHDGRNIVDKQFASHFDVFPLYTTPPAQPAVPLTEPELRAVLEKTNHMITNTMRGPFWPELEQACRAIEAAHGITGTPEKGGAA